jgi:hypothetical protein
MRKSLVAATSIAALLSLSSAANAQQNTVTGAAGGAVTGAIVGGPVGAVVGGVVGATVGSAVDANQQNRTVIVEDPPTQRQRTCVIENGIERCREVVR